MLPDIAATPPPAPATSHATPARDFLHPRLVALLDDAAGQGIARDVAVAVLIDMVTGEFNTAPLDATQDTEPAPNDSQFMGDLEAAARDQAQNMGILESTRAIGAGLLNRGHGVV